LHDWIAELFRDPKLLGMGHGQSRDDLNLGLGWVYYGLARALRPRTAVVIGSYRGFVPLVIGKALADNGDGGEVVFVDPSFVDDFWKDPEAVESYFDGHGLRNVRHFLMTTQEFSRSEEYRRLGTVGMVFVDGHHTVEQARLDHETFAGLLGPSGIVLFHDTAGYRVSGMHGPDRTYRHSVKDYVDSLKRDPQFQVLDLPVADGVTLVRRSERVQ
jgi:predicted O-methyltransferase YrrM